MFVTIRYNTRCSAVEKRTTLRKVCAKGVPQMEVMTDKQWDGMLAMVIKIIEKCKDKDEALTELYDLVRKEPPSKN